MSQMLLGKGPTTDANGRFVVERVPPGKITLLVMSKTSAFQDLAKQEHTVTAGQRLDVGTIKVITPRGDDAGTLGFSTSVDDDKLLVGVVKGDGPAATAGVAEGDRIVAIDGRPVAQLGVETAQQLIASGNVAIGQKVQLGLEREGKPVAATVVAVKW
jgi:C-terminal processing protease CtpA/Prc